MGIGSEFDAKTDILPYSLPYTCISKSTSIILFYTCHARSSCKKMFQLNVDFILHYLHVISQSLSITFELKIFKTYILGRSRLSWNHEFVLNSCNFVIIISIVNSGSFELANMPCIFLYAHLMVRDVRVTRLSRPLFLQTLCLIAWSSRCVALLNLRYKLNCIFRSTV